MRAPDRRDADVARDRGCSPAPIAGPLIAAITGAGCSTIASSTVSNAGRNMSTVLALPPSPAKRVTRSAPEQNAEPAPVMTTARRSG